MKTFKSILASLTILSAALSAEAANRRPVVNAGPNQQGIAASPLPLVGRVSDDGLPRGQQLRIRWRKISGPGTVTFANPRSARTTATFSRSGTYVLCLRGNDGQLIAEDTLRVRVSATPARPDPRPANEPPLVNAGGDQQVTFVGAQMQVPLGGSVIDLDGPLPLTFAWRQVEGPAPVSFTNPSQTGGAALIQQPGRYRFTLEAFDGINLVSDDVVILVDPASGDAGSFLRRADINRGNGVTLVRLHNDHPTRQIDFRIRYIAQPFPFVQAEELSYNFTILPGSFHDAPMVYFPGGSITFIEVIATYR